MSRHIGCNHFKHLFKHAIVLYASLLINRSAKRVDDEGIDEIFEIADNLCNQYDNRLEAIELKQREKEHAMSDL